MQRLVVLILGFQIASAAHAQTAAMRQAAHWLWTGGGCPSAPTSEQESQALERLTQSCFYSSNNWQLRGVARAASRDTEGVYFGLLAGQYERDLKCSADQTERFSSGADLDALTEDLARKVPVLQALDREIFAKREASRQAQRQIDRSRAGIGPSLAQARKNANALDADIRRLDAQRRSVYASIAFSELEDVRTVLNQLIGPSPVDARIALPPVGQTVRDRAALKDQLGRTYAQLTQKLRQDASRMRAAAAAEGAGLTGNDRYVLASDPRLAERLFEQTPAVSRSCGGTRVAVRAGGNTCENPSAVEMVAQDNCALDVALSALTFGAASAFTAAEVSEFVRYLRGRSAPEAPGGAPRVVAQAVDEGRISPTPAAREEPRGAISTLPASVSGPLPPEFLEQVRTSQAARDLQATYGRGRGLHIKIDHYDQAFERTGRPGQAGAAHLGESTQVVFTARVLREILPEAQISEGRLTNSAPGSVRLTITDTAEHRHFTRPTVPSHLEMADIKLANPGTLANRSEVRRALGISESSRVISLNNSLYNKAEQISELVREISTVHPHVVIISQSFQEQQLPRLREVLTRDYPYHRVVLASELDGQKLDPTVRYLVLNDSTGRMNSVYAAADANVTAGAVNLAEPVLQRTPTVYFGANSSYMHGYDAAVFTQQARTVDQTGLTREIVYRVELRSTLESVLARPPEARAMPYQIRTASGETPLDHYLNRLRDNVDFQVDREGVRSRFPVNEQRQAQMMAIRRQAIDNSILRWRSLGQTLDRDPRQLTLALPTETIRTLSPENARTLYNKLGEYRAVIMNVANNGRSPYVKLAVRELGDLDRELRGPLWSRIHGQPAPGGLLPETRQLFERLRTTHYHMEGVRREIDRYLSPSTNGG